MGSKPSAPKPQAGEWRKDVTDVVSQLIPLPYIRDLVLSYALTDRLYVFEFRYPNRRVFTFDFAFAAPDPVAQPFVAQQIAADGGTLRVHDMPLVGPAQQALVQRTRALWRDVDYPHKPGRGACDNTQHVPDGAAVASAVALGGGRVAVVMGVGAADAFVSLSTDPRNRRGYRSDGSHLHSFALACDVHSRAAGDANATGVPEEPWDDEPPVGGDGEAIAKQIEALQSHWEAVTQPDVPRWVWAGIRACHSDVNGGAFGARFTGYTTCVVGSRVYCFGGREWWNALLPNAVGRLRKPAWYKPEQVARQKAWAARPLPLGGDVKAYLRAIARHTVAGLPRVYDDAVGAAFGPGAPRATAAHFLPDCAYFDAVTEQWTALPPMRTGRFGPIAVPLPTERTVPSTIGGPPATAGPHILVLGGRQCTLLDPNAHSELPPVERAAHLHAALIPDHLWTYDRAVETLDTQTGQWASSVTTPSSGEGVVFPPVPWAIPDAQWGTRVPVWREVVGSAFTVWRQHVVVCGGEAAVPVRGIGPLRSAPKANAKAAAASADAKASAPTAVGRAAASAATGSSSDTTGDELFGASDVTGACWSLSIATLLAPTPPKPKLGPYPVRPRAEWQRMGSGLNVPRTGAYACVLDDRLLVLGGWRQPTGWATAWDPAHWHLNATYPGVTARCSVAEEWDPQAGEWRILSQLRGFGGTLIACVCTV